MNLNLNKIINRIRKIKHIEIIIAIMIGVIVISIYFIPDTSKSNDKSNTNSISINTEVPLDDEQRLKTVLAKITGVGRTEVMITYETGTELVPALDYNLQKNSQNQKTENGNTSTETSVLSQKPVTIYEQGENRALILVERKPQIRGVIVVAEGAADVKVKLELYKAVQTVLQISAEKVNVFEMNK